MSEDLIEGDDHMEPDENGEIECPFCGSADTRLEQKVGSALCRTVHYCLDCRNQFEEFS